MMRASMLVVSVGLFLLTSGHLAAQPPDAFELIQNIPNPFCPGGAGGYTEIRMTLPQEAVVLLEVWSPDTTVAVRTLVYGMLPAGYHSAIWDGRDDGGSILSEGAYPYTMAATEVGTGDPLFSDTLVATIDCGVATKPMGWGKIKAAFGR